MANNSPWQLGLLEYAWQLMVETWVDTLCHNGASRENPEVMSSSSRNSWKFHGKLCGKPGNSMVNPEVSL